MVDGLKGREDEQRYRYRFCLALHVPYTTKRRHK